MFALIAIATSGLQASAARLNASASNVANARTAGPVPSTPPIRPVKGEGEGRRVYQPVEVVQSTLPGGGTRASYHPRLPAYILSHDPHAPDADADGMIAMPNVDYSSEVAEQIRSVIAFKANLKALQVAQEMGRSLLAMKV